MLQNARVPTAPEHLKNGKKFLQSWKNHGILELYHVLWKNNSLPGKLAICTIIKCTQNSLTLCVPKLSALGCLQYNFSHSIQISYSLQRTVHRWLIWDSVFKEAFLWKKGVKLWKIVDYMYLEICLQYWKNHAMLSVLKSRDLTVRWDVHVCMNCLIL